MFECSIVGIKLVDFEKDGQRMIGVKIYVTAESEKVEGLMTDSFFFSREKFPEAQKLVVGDSVIVYFNRYGKPNSIVAV